jgi:hypothetical protein
MFECHELAGHGAAALYDATEALRLISSLLERMSSGISANAQGESPSQMLMPPEIPPTSLWLKLLSKSR